MATIEDILNASISDEDEVSDSDPTISERLSVNTEPNLESDKRLETRLKNSVGKSLLSQLKSEARGYLLDNQLVSTINSQLLSQLDFGDIKTSSEILFRNLFSRYVTSELTVENFRKLFSNEESVESRMEKYGKEPIDRKNFIRDFEGFDSSYWDIVIRPSTEMINYITEYIDDSDNVIKSLNPGIMPCTTFTVTAFSLASTVINLSNDSKMDIPHKESRPSEMSIQCSEKSDYFFFNMMESYIKTFTENENKRVAPIKSMCFDIYVYIYHRQFSNSIFRKLFKGLLRPVGTLITSPEPSTKSTMLTFSILGERDVEISDIENKYKS